MTDTHRHFDPAQIGVGPLYRLLIDAVIPRPIAFISSLSADGHGNLAPFSYFNLVSTAPATLSISIARKPHGEKKDTLRNIEETRQFVVNSVNEWFLEKAHQTSAPYDYGIDEMKKVGLTPVASTRVKPPRVAESAIQLECELLQTVEIGQGGAGSTTLVLGTIVAIHVREDLLMPDGRIDPVKLEPIARLGGNSYGRLGAIVDIPRAEVKG